MLQVGAEFNVKPDTI